MLRDNTVLGRGTIVLLRRTASASRNQKRFIHNEDEVMAALQAVAAGAGGGGGSDGRDGTGSSKTKFLPIDPAETTFEEMREIIGGASVVVGAHGGAMCVRITLLSRSMQFTSWYTPLMNRVHAHKRAPGEQRRLHTSTEPPPPPPPSFLTFLRVRRDVGWLHRGLIRYNLLFADTSASVIEFVPDNSQGLNIFSLLSTMVGHNYIRCMEKKQGNGMSVNIAKLEAAVRGALLLSNQARKESDQSRTNR